MKNHSKKRFPLDSDPITENQSNLSHEDQNWNEKKAVESISTVETIDLTTLLEWFWMQRFLSGLNNINDR